MKVWECKISAPNTLYYTGGNPPKKVVFTDIVIYPQDWNLVSNVEITERLPDYAGMAEKRQFGKFWCIGEEAEYGELTEYDKDDDTELPFSSNDNWYSFFTPCAEPVELDPITMEEKTK